MIVIANKTEAQRILSLLEDALNSLNLLAGIPLRLSQDPNLHFSPDVSNILSEQQDMEENVMKSFLMPPFPYSPALPIPESSPLFPPPETELSAYQSQSSNLFPSRCSPHSSGNSSRDTMLKNHLSITRHLVRTMRRFHPKIDACASPTFSLFIGALCDLRNILTQRFSTTLQDDLRRVNTLGKLTDKEKHMFDSLALLQHVSTTKEREQSEEITTLEGLREKLETELAVQEAQSKEERDNIAQELKNSLDLAHTRHAAKITELRKCLEDLVPILAQEAKKYEFTEQLMKEKQTLLEEKLADVMQNYEADVKQKQDDLRWLRATAREEKNELHALREHFAVVERQQAELNNMERERQERALEAEARMRHAVECAIRIQSVFRKHKAVMGYQALKKSGKLAGGDKKAKKKKPGVKAGTKGFVKKANISKAAVSNVSKNESATPVRTLRKAAHGSKKEGAGRKIIKKTK